MSTQYPILPINNKQSYKLFTHLVALGFSQDKTFLDMAIKWCEYVAREEARYSNILPTAPAYLRRHFKKWKKGQRAQKQLEDAKTQKQLNETNKILKISNTAFLNELQNTDNNVFGVGHRETLIETTPSVQPNASAEGSRDVINVDTELLAESEAQSDLTAAPAVTVERTRRRYRFKKNKKQRQGRTCKICVKYGNNRISKTCEGRFDRKKCPYNRTETV